MKIVSILATAGLLLTAGHAAAQDQGGTSTTTSTVDTPLGPATVTTTTVPYNNGTWSSTTVSPSGSGIQPYVGSTTSDPYPNNQQSSTGPTAGVIIPIPE